MSVYKKFQLSGNLHIRMSNIRRPRYQKFRISEGSGERSSRYQKVWISDIPDIRIFGY
jgi:hypothetical protein